MLEHGIEDGQQLAYAGCERQLLGLTPRQQPLVEVPDYRVVAAGYQRAPPQTARLPLWTPLSRL